jgi:small subunit ribosomal protein S17
MITRESCHCLCAFFVSDKPEKTIVVAIQTRYQHPKYQKILIKTKRYMA